MQVEATCVASASSSAAATSAPAATALTGDGKKTSEQQQQTLQTTIIVDDQRTCLDCGQTFQQVSAKNRHMRTHSGVKPYKCFYCDYATDRKESLKNHCIKRHEMTKEEFKGRADIVFS